MNKRGLFLIIVGIMSICIVFADVQKGRVRTIKRSGKKVEYLANTQISVKGISGSFKSGSNGYFELELRPLNLKTGQPFSLSKVFKTGYELYDNDLRHTYSPTSSIEIVLRNIKQEADDRETYAKNLNKSSEAKYKKRISELEKQLREGKISQEKYREDLRRYQDLFDKYQSQIDVIAKRYAGLDYMNIDPQVEAINIAFMNGDFELADSLLNAVGDIESLINSNLKARSDIDAKIDFGNAIVAEGNNERKQNLHDAERLAELAYAKHQSFLNNFQNDSAAYWLEKRAELLPENINYQLEAGLFICDYLADYNKAMSYYNKVLALTLDQYGENHPDVATSYNNIGLVYDCQGDYPRAMENYEKALKIRLGIFGENHPDVALIYNNIGAVYDSQGDYPRAMENYEKALKILLGIFGENHPHVKIVKENIAEVKSKLEGQKH